MNSRIPILFLAFMAMTTLKSVAQYQVGHSTFNLVDASRANRDIAGHLYYPADTAGDDVAWANGSFPLIVFGHGFGMAWSEYSVWWEELTSKGYVLAFPTTEGAIFPFPNHADFGQDMAFIIDAYMLQNTDSSSPFHQKFTGKNALMGHSMGGGCSYLAAGDYGADVATMVTLAAANTDPSSITAAAGITIPVLTIAGSKDCVVQEGGAPIDIYNGLANASYKAYINITDASHCQFGIASFGSICTLGELCGGFLDDTAQHQQMFLNAVPWLDYHLKDDCDAWGTFQGHLTTSTAHSYQEAGALPLPTLQASASSSTICPGETTTLQAQVAGVYCSFEWLKDGVVVSTDVQAQVAEGGIYDAVASNADGVTTTESVTIELAPEPTASITETEGVLQSNVSGGSSFSYQWYLNGNPIDDATDVSYDAGIMGISGMYSLEVSNEAGCTAFSNALQVTLTALVELGQGQAFLLYPSHTDGQLTLDWQGPVSQGTWRIVDTQGRVLEQGQTQFQTEQPWEMDMGHLPRGLYFLILDTAAGRGASRFVRR